MSDFDIDPASRIHPADPRRDPTDMLATDMLATHLANLHPSRPAGLVAKPNTRFGRKAVVVRADADATNWIKKDPTVLMASAAGWFIPSNIGVSAFGGKSLFGLLTASIGENMAHFPVGPALDDKFWLYMVTWHVGLFVTMTLGQIGFQGRKQGYW
jgi:photosystem I subunit PsaO